MANLVKDAIDGHSSTGEMIEPRSEKNGERQIHPEAPEAQP